MVAAEDTRRTGSCCKHFGISKPLLSYFQFNEAKRSEEIIERLRRGEKIALVTDAGSPGISDPGRAGGEGGDRGGAARRIGARAVRAGGRADGQRAADRRVSFHRLPAAQVRSAPPANWNAPEHRRDARALRIAVPRRKAAGRTERGVSRNARWCWRAS